MNAQDPNFQSAMEKATEQAASLAKFLADNPLDYGAFFQEVAADLEKQIQTASTATGATHPQAKEIESLVRSLRQAFSG